MRSAKHYATPGIPPDRGAEWCPSRYWDAPVPYRVNAPVGGPAVQAVVNHGRWVIACPDCSGAQLACLTDPRFMCSDCGNAGNRGLWRPVVIPADVAGIEAALAVRSADLQNTTAGQTVADLVAENELLSEAVIL